MRYIFFTDLDGTLLDHHSYSAEKSMQGIRLLAGNNIPLIAVSSKTFDEMLPIIKKLELTHSPFAFENGAGLAFPDGTGGYNITAAGPGYDALASYLPEIEKKTGRQLKAIKSLTDSEVSELTGLDKDSAPLAKKRMSTVPFIADETGTLTDEEIILINDSFRERGFYLTKGGRFNHILPSASGKGVAIKKIIEFYSNTFNDEIIAAAAGDSVNDIPMLEIAGFPYIVKRQGGSFISLKNAQVTDGEGPAGFTEAVVDFINKTAG